MQKLDKITIILHVSENCNLRCKYCYVRENHEFSELQHVNLFNTFDAIKKIIDSNANGGTKIILHGGEPLMMPCEQMDNFLSLITTYAEECKYKISFSMQTNGLLVDEAWIHILKKYNVRIGVSLDGCNEEQNAYRVNAAGDSVFIKVLERLKFLEMNEMRPGVIFTVNKNHIGKEKELLNFIEGKKIKCNIRPAFPTGEIGVNICMTPDEYVIFFCNMFDMWFKEEKYETFLVKEFEIIIRKVLGGEKECHNCVDSSDCSKHFISMGMNGSCYPCNRLYNNSHFFMGNLCTDSLESVMEIGYSLADKRKGKLTQCKHCDIQEICHGGCPAIAYSTYGNYFMRDYFCEAYQGIYRHVKNVLF